MDAAVPGSGGDAARVPGLGASSASRSSSSGPSRLKEDREDKAGAAPDRAPASGLVGDPVAAAAKREAVAAGGAGGSLSAAADSAVDRRAAPVLGVAGLEAPPDRAASRG